MRYVKKTLALLVAAVMTLLLATSAFATSGVNDNNGKITIDNAVVGQTYSIYQILKLESYDTGTTTGGVTTGAAYAYKATNEWNAFVNSTDDEYPVNKYLNVDTQGYVTWVKDADAAAFAKLALKYAQNNPETVKNSKKGPTIATSTTVTFTGLNLGYYLVDTSLGALCSLSTTNPTTTIQEKNEVPSIEKQAQEDSDNSWGDKNDADIGQTVNFKTIVHAKKGAQNYVVHDKMSAGLTLDKDSIQVYVGSAKLQENIDYTVFTDVKHFKKDANNNDTTEVDYTCDFEIHFTQAYLNKITANTDITITYSAVLNENAVIAGDGNPNETKLDYGDDSSTEWDKTITYTWKMDVLKYGNGDEKKVLKDAQFVLLNSDKSKVATIVNGKVTGWVVVPTATEGQEITWPENTVLTTNDQGKIDISGLDADTYFLREVEAPNGYNKLADDPTFTITANADKTTGALTQTSVTAKINNQTGALLPTTGGRGTTLIYIVGGLLVVGAGAVLFLKNRQRKQK